MIPSLQQCYEEVEKKNVVCRSSSSGRYTIFNYTPHCQYKRNWNDINMWCRGLIFDNETKSVVSVPFRKFFGIDQHENWSLENVLTWGKPTRILEKMDGSLGICFWNKEEKRVNVATRGSFTSDQAVWATNWINDPNSYSSETEKKLFFNWVKENQNLNTLLIEIVYKKNRIIVDYKNFEGLVPLACVEHATKQPIVLTELLPVAWKRPQEYSASVKDLLSRREALAANEEGWVLFFKNGMLLKIKGSQYETLHRFKYSMSKGHIFDVCAENNNKAKTLDIFSDRLYSLLDTETFEEITSTVCEIFKVKQDIENDFKFSIKSFTALPTRKENAVWAKHYINIEYMSLFFSWLDKNPNFEDLLWKMTKKQLSL